MTELKRNYPDAKIIIMTREPVEFVASLHSQNTFSGIEYEDLETAWRREKNRLERVIADSRNGIEYVVNWRLAYPELAQHHKYIARYIELFGNQNVLVVDHSQLKAGAAEVYRRIISFLGLLDDGRKEFPVVNANKVSRSVFIQDVLHWLLHQDLLVRFGRKVKGILGVRSFGIFSWITHRNTKEILRQKVDDDLALDIIRTINMNRDV
jgi:hypothetical protein